MDSIEHINNVFLYNSPIGLFFIKYNRNNNKWILGKGSDIYGQYSSPIAAADDIYCQSIGCYEWDSFEIDLILEEIPTDIYCWELLKN